MGHEANFLRGLIINVMQCRTARGDGCWLVNVSSEIIHVNVR